MLARALLGLLALLALGTGLLAVMSQDRRALEIRDHAAPAVSINGTDPLRLVALGTSLTARYDWPQQVGLVLERCLDRPVLVTKVAKADANASWGAEQVDTVLAADPDIILVEFAINDADLLDGLSLVESERLHRQILTDLRNAAPSISVVLMTMNPALGLRGVVRPRLGRYYSAYAALAESLDVGLLDLYPRWLARTSQRQGLEVDGLHPDPATASAMIVPALARHLGLALGTMCQGRTSAHGGADHV